MDVTERRAHSLTPSTSTGTAGSCYLQRATYRTFDEDCEFLRDPQHRANISEYLTDMLAPYGLPLDEKLLESGVGQSYGEMAARLVAELIEVDEPVDLLVVAFGMPDVWPGRATATYLSEVCPGNPLSFAICDQGIAGAYTALRLVREYVRTGACERALLLALEQPTLPYPLPGKVPVPGRAAAVGLVCGAKVGPGAVAISSVEVYPDMTPERAALLLGHLDEGAALVTGYGLDSLALPRVSRRAPAGQPYTGGLSTLATAAKDAGGGRFVIADYDPYLRYLCAVTAELSG